MISSTTIPIDEVTTAYLENTDDACNGMKATLRMPDNQTIAESKQSWEKLDNSHIEVPKIQTSVMDVAAYIVEKVGEISIEKLQKLVYYCQAWSLVWDDMPIFSEPIEAWISGPVVRKLFYFFQGRFMIESVPVGSPRRLSDIQCKTIDSVLEFYGGKSSCELREIVRLEDPWNITRRGMMPEMRGNREIPMQTIYNYYSSL